MSISSAPSLIVLVASIALIIGLCVPLGKPITVQVFTPLPLSAPETQLTYGGLMQTLQN